MGRPPLTKEILVMCPSCHKTGTVAVDPRLVKGAQELEGDSMLEVHVFSGDICGHDFTVTVDAHFKVRQAELPPT